MVAGIDFVAVNVHKYLFLGKFPLSFLHELDVIFCSIFIIFALVFTGVKILKSGTGKRLGLMNFDLIVFALLVSGGLIISEKRLTTNPPMEKEAHSK